MTTQPARKYNPGFLTDPELVETFCVRQIEFESVLDTLRGCIGPANQPQIVIGPRGSGKTTLLLRVAAEVRRDPALSSRFFPVVFAEESYEVSTAGEFWLECLSQLADQAPVRPEDPDLHRTAEALRGDMDDRSLADRCLGALLDFADRENKRLVLFVENLNMMFRDMADSDAGWRLRKILQTEPRIVLIASATNRFDEMGHPDHALYDMFRVCVLRRLDTAECAALWERVSGRSVEQRTIRSLEILTGGSPRLVAIVARFGAARSFLNLMDELLDLVDDHTEYFKSHIESLPPQERRIYLALADLWKPATAREIAVRSRLDTNACSANLARLTERGFVEVDGGSPRRRQYYVSERLYNVYYLLRRRRGSDPLVEALVRFMESLYTPRELMDITSRIGRDAETCNRETLLLHQTAFARLVSSPKLAPYRGALYAAVPANVASGLDLDSLRPDGSAVLADGKGSRDGHTMGANGVVAADGELTSLREQLLAHANADTEEEFEEALSKYRIAYHSSGASEDALAPIARALTSRGIAYGSRGLPKDAVAFFDRAVQCVGDNDGQVSHEAVGIALLNKGTALRELNRPEEVMDALDEAIRRFGSVEDSVPRDSFAIALLRKAALLEELGRTEEAVATWSEVIRRFSSGETVSLLDSVATAFLRKASLLDDSGRSEEALAEYDDLVSRFGASAQLSLLESVATALINKGVVLSRLGRTQEQLAVCDDVIRRFGESQDNDLLEIVVMALVRKGVALSRLDQTESAISIWDEIVRRFGESEHVPIREEVSHALFHKAIALRQLDRGEDSLAVCDDMLDRLGEPKEGRQLESVAVALGTKASLLLDLKQPEESMAVSEEVLNRLELSDDPSLLRFVGRALISKGIALRSLDRVEDELSVWDEVVRRFGDAENSELQEQMGRALLLKGRTLDKMSRSDDGLIARRDLVARFGSSKLSTLQGLVQVSLGEIADTEVMRGHYDGAIEAAGQLLHKTGTVSDENRWQAHSVRAAAMIAKGNAPESERDIRAVLEILPELDELPSDAIRDLISLSLQLSVERMSELIQESPSKVVLMPLTTALEQELGRRPRVAREVEEVARDIRRQMARVRESRSM